MSLNYKFLGQTSELHCNTIQYKEYGYSRSFFLCLVKSFPSECHIEKDIKLNLVYWNGKIYWYACAECTIYFICLEFCLKLFVLLLRIEKRYILYKIELDSFLSSMASWKLTHSKLTNKYLYVVHSRLPHSWSNYVMTISQYSLQCPPSVRRG